VTYDSTRDGEVAELRDRVRMLEATLFQTRVAMGIIAILSILTIIAIGFAAWSTVNGY